MRDSVSAEIESNHASGEAGSAEAGRPPAAACLVGESDLQIWFQSPAQRMKRILDRAGITRFVDEGDLAGQQDAVLLVHAGAVIDAPLVGALLAAPGTVLLANGPSEGMPLAVNAPAGLARASADVLNQSSAATLPDGLRAAGSASLGASYWHALRKREEPYALLPSPADRARTEWRMFMGTYKGATDFVTKWLWPRPAYYVTKLCAHLGITPNQVTAVSLVMVIAACYWFWQGDWLLGLLAAWLMTFLDTVDGKLARITLNSSKFGNFFDHSIDLVHPPFWYLAWGIGLEAGPHGLEPETLAAMLSVIIGGYVLQRVLEGIAIWRFKLEIHVWRRIDTWFRLVTARRNPNLVLLTLGAVAGRPDLGFFAVAAWTAICLLLHLLQLLQAAAAARQEGKLTSWLTSTN